MSSSRPRRRVTTGIRLAVAICAVGGCTSGGDDRPSVESWRPVWEERQALMPDADLIIAGGEDLCGERLGTLRLELPALRPTPSEALDSAVDEWAAHAETIVFECVSDPADLAEQLATLDTLGAEVDAGLDAG